ncbi:MAG: hypothetical protein ACLFWG_09685 [Longimicrobiales bacterium]
MAESTSTETPKAPRERASRSGSSVVESSGILWFDEIGSGDTARVGGKAASLGEMCQSLGGKGLPPRWATTADAYDEFLDGELTEETWARSSGEPRRTVIAGSSSGSGSSRA